MAVVVSKQSWVQWSEWLVARSITTDQQHHSTNKSTSRLLSLKRSAVVYICSSVTGIDLCLITANADHFVTHCFLVIRNILTYLLTYLSSPVLSCAAAFIFLQRYLMPAILVSFSISVFQVLLGHHLPLWPCNVHSSASFAMLSFSACFQASFIFFFLVTLAPALCQFSSISHQSSIIITVPQFVVKSQVFIGYSSVLCTVQVHAGVSRALNYLRSFHT